MNGGTGNLPIGPGILGFIAVFVLALALWVLMRNMNSRMRRMAYRERDEQRGRPTGGPRRSSPGPAVDDAPTDPDTDDPPSEQGQA